MIETYTELNQDKLSRIFDAFAERECKGVSELYFNLSKEIAKDNEILELSALARMGQPIPNLLLGAVQFLLLNSTEYELSQYYPSISGNQVQEIPFLLFKEFCLKHRSEIESILASRIVQTNAINRVAYIAPIFSSIFDEPINVIDIGTSSGLALNFDLYEYSWGDSVIGDSPVKIKSEILEGKLPEFDSIVNVKRKIGIDQNPIDLTIEDEANWLKALIWADQHERFERLDHSIDIARTSKIELFKASQIEQFKEIIDSIPYEEPLAIYHTSVLYQFTEEDRESFRDMIDKIGSKRDLVYLASEGSTIYDGKYEQSGMLVELNAYKGGSKMSRLIAETNGHANWIKWK